MTGVGSDLWITTLSGTRRSQPAWAEIAHYLDPVRRYIARFHPRMSETDRDDVAQEVLIAMHESLVVGYDRSRGRFREYLRGALEHKIRDWFRERRRGLARDEEVEPDQVAAPGLASSSTDDIAAAIDFEAELLRAIRCFHDAHAAGEGEDLQLVYCFSDRLIRDLAESEIAVREKLSRDRVKRFLARARDEILASLAGAILERDGAPSLPGERLRVATLVRDGIRRPRERARIVEREEAPRLRSAAEDLLDAIDAARRHFVGLGTEAGRELLRGLDEVFAGT